VSRGHGAHLLTEVSSSAATCPTAQGSAFLRGELRCCHVSHGSGGLWTTGIKKGLAVLGTQLGSRGFKAHSCVTKAPANVQATTMRPYSAVSVQLTTPVHGYSGDVI
jgi:hypothetical protein